MKKTYEKPYITLNFRESDRLFIQNKIDKCKKKIEATNRALKKWEDRLKRNETL